MKKLLSCGLILGALATPIAAGAGSKKGDMKTMTCEEFLAMDEEDGGVMLFWLDGYLSGLTGDTRFDKESLLAFAEKMGKACAKSPEAKVIDTAKIVGTD